jgi:hypothetical protein
MFIHPAYHSHNYTKESRAGLSTTENDIHPAFVARECPFTSPLSWLVLLTLPNETGGRGGIHAHCTFVVVVVVVVLQLRCQRRAKTLLISFASNWKTLSEELRKQQDLNRKKQLQKCAAIEYCSTAWIRYLLPAELYRSIWMNNREGGGASRFPIPWILVIWRCFELLTWIFCTLFHLHPAFL